MLNLGNFPFGEPVTALSQRDRTPKRVFVHGVYASAVHAKWIDTKSKVVVKALAVASEPHIFWTGESEDVVISRVNIPSALGILVPADKQFNGPSGLALDNEILHPLGVLRQEAWLCDLVPYSCLNPKQNNAILEKYVPWVQKGIVQPVRTMPVPRILTTDKRIDEITQELMESKAECMILLGDQPIKWYLSKFTNKWKTLSDFGEDIDTYGKVHPVTIEGQTINVLPLAHPRQIAKLGTSSQKWYQLHKKWKQLSKYNSGQKNPTAKDLLELGLSHGISAIDEGDLECGTKRLLARLPQLLNNVNDIKQ
jgi:uracil-DNA glycosylase